MGVQDDGPLQHFDAGPIDCEVIVNRRLDPDAYSDRVVLIRIFVRSCTFLGLKLLLLELLILCRGKLAALCVRLSL